MIRIITLLLFLRLALPFSYGEGLTVKLLTIGNSFADDSVAYLPQMAAATGQKLVLLRANLGGHSLEQHAGYLAACEANPNDPKGRAYKNRAHPRTQEKRDFSLVEALQAETWDYVTIQQVSRLSFQTDSYEPYAERIVGAIRKYAPQAKILVHETWAYREDSQFLKTSNMTQAQMYEGLHAAYKALAERYQLEVIPVGTAFQRARATDRWRFRPDAAFDFASPIFPIVPHEPTSLNVGWKWQKSRTTGENVFRLDANHASVAGRYLGGAVFYRFLFPGAPETSFVPKELHTEDAASLRQVAASVVP